MKITYVSIDEWIKKKVRNYWFTCMDLEGIILSEISQSEKDRYYMICHLHVESKKI